MALKKFITLDNGISVEYHRVKSISVENDYDPLRDIESTENPSENPADLILVSCIIQSFVNEDYRNQSLSNFIMQRHYEFSVERQIVEDNNIFEVAYGLLKTTDAFEDAEDV